MLPWSQPPDSRTPTPGWLVFAAGVAAGFAGSLLLRRHTGTPATLPRLSRAWEDASRRLEAMTETLREPEPLDLDAVQRTLDGLPGGQGLRLRILTDGILEVVGTASDVEQARRVLDALSREPGVRAVVNRVWTPSSASPDDD